MAVDRLLKILQEKQKKKMLLFTVIKKKTHLRMKVTKFGEQVLQDSCVYIGICVHYRVFLFIYQY